MDDLLQHLENQVKKLLDQFDQMKRSNVQLNQGKFLLAREKEMLLEKQKKAVHQIELLVSLLKSVGKLT